MKYDPDKHHRRSIRLKGYDYSQAGVYFVTVCVQNRECLFGEIRNCEMELNMAGKMVHGWWNHLPQKYVVVELDDYIIMSNHLHGIIIINDHRYSRHCRGDCSRGEVTSPLQMAQPQSLSQPTLGNIIAYFKYQSTKHINQFRNTPGIKLWQRNYYEHIIRDENEINRMRIYIVENSSKWDLDNGNPHKRESN